MVEMFKKKKLNVNKEKLKQFLLKIIFVYTSRTITVLLP